MSKNLQAIKFLVSEINNFSKSSNNQNKCNKRDERLTKCPSNTFEVNSNRQRKVNL